MANQKQQNLPVTGTKQQITIKQSSAKASALKNAPEEVLAAAIHDLLLKEHDRSQPSKK